MTVCHPFIPGLKLSEMFYHEAVKPHLNLPHSAALIGSGSEVLGFDTEMSTDHHWGPRVMLFLHPDDHATSAETIKNDLKTRLPYTFHGYPTSFGEPDSVGVQLMETRVDGPVNHRVDTLTIAEFVSHYLNIDLDTDIEAADWLTFPEQRLLTFTGGSVFHDDLGLQAVRDRFAYYPHDVWLYLLASGWSRIGQDEHLMPRAGYVGDELGSSLIGARLVRDVMRLCFLMERQYAPYPKWLGTAFSRLACAGRLIEPLRAAQSAPTWEDRERHLSIAYKRLARMHNALDIAPPIPESVSNFHGRPFMVIHGEAVAEAIATRITDPVVQAIITLNKGRFIGNIDLVSDNTDVLENISRRLAWRELYVKPVQSQQA
jgi:hypothetical protein